MSVLIEKPENGLYLSVASQWAAKTEAYDFRSPALAIELCTMRRLRNVRIIVNLGDSANDFSLLVCGAGQGGAAVTDSRHNRTRRSSIAKVGAEKKTSVPVRARRRGMTNGHDLAEGLEPNTSDGPRVPDAC